MGMAARDYILAAMLLVSVPVSADTYLDVYGFAYHTDSSRSCSKVACRDKPNQENYGLGLRRSLEHYDVGAGAFKDSHADWSYYVGIEKQWRLFGPVHGGAQVMMMGRQDYRDYRPFVGVLPVVSIRVGGYALNMSYVPKYEPWKMREVFFFYASAALD